MTGQGAIFIACGTRESARRLAIPSCTSICIQRTGCSVDPCSTGGLRCVIEAPHETPVSRADDVARNCDHGDSLVNGTSIND